MEHNGNVKTSDGTIFEIADKTARESIDGIESEITDIKFDIDNLRIPINQAAGYFNTIAEITADGAQIDISNLKLLGAAIRIQAAPVSGSGSVEFDVISYNGVKVGHILIPYGADVTADYYALGRVVPENCYWASYESAGFSSGQLEQRLDPITYRYDTADYTEIKEIKTVDGNHAPAGFVVTVLGVS